MNDLGVKVGFCKMNEKVIKKFQSMGINGNSMEKDNLEVLE
jgi:hypothetical protein